jgi:hypothetical protein
MMICEIINLIFACTQLGLLMDPYGEISPYIKSINFFINNDINRRSANNRNIRKTLTAKNEQYMKIKFTINVVSGKTNFCVFMTES